MRSNVWGSGVLCSLVVACAAAPVSPEVPDDPVVAQARALLVENHPSGERVVSVKVTGASRGAGIDALLAALGDPSTRLLPADAWPAFLAEVSGQPTTGVGLRELLDLDLGPGGRLVVITTQPSGPAARAGLGPGDVLEAVDGQPAGDLTGAMARLRGPAGSDVRLTVRRAGEARSLALRREMLPGAGDHVRSGRLDGGTLHLAVDGVSAETPAAVERVLVGQGDGGMVLDLRNNPGGDVDAVLAVAGLFVGDREVVQAVGRERRVLRSTGASRVRGQVAVLVNEGSASAAELLALVLRESGHARLFGQRTAGKALLHIPGPLDDGSVLLISTARLVRLDGREILGRGLEPDVAVPWADSVHPPLEVPGHLGEDPQLAAALRWLGQAEPPDPSPRSAGGLPRACSEGDGLAAADASTYEHPLIWRRSPSPSVRSATRPGSASSVWWPPRP